MRVRVSRWANGHTIVTVTLTEDHITVRYSQRTYSNTIAEGVAEAKAGAHRALEAARG